MLQCKALFPPDWMDIALCPLFAALPSKQQQEVFRPAPQVHQHQHKQTHSHTTSLLLQGCRKVILSTNIAETSITLPGVCHVLDTGVVKARGYNPLIGLDILCVQPVSKAQARQRAGRAGREAPGTCYRLYTEHAFEELSENTEPEILRCPLNSVVLELLAMGVTDLLSFDFMSAPSEDNLVAALEQLCHLGAVEGREGGEGVILTPLGRRMARFPLEPSLAKAILMAPVGGEICRCVCVLSFAGCLCNNTPPQEYGCSEEVVAIVSLLSVDSVLFTPPTHRDKAAAVQLKFHSPDGDHLTLLAIFHAHQAAQGNKVPTTSSHVTLVVFVVLTD